LSELLLGIDCGSTVTKAALFDVEGRELGSSASSTETRALANGGVERSTEALWTSVVEAVRTVVSELGPSSGTIAAIGCSGHGNGLYALDAHGQALPTAYQSLDSRADTIVADWIEQGLGEALFEDAWQQAWPGQPLALLEWLRRHEPGTYEAISTVLLCKDFVNYRLTGRAASEYSDMSATGLLVNAGLEYNHRLIEQLGLEDISPKLPELVASTDVVGTLTATAADELGLAAGTPVVGGLFDVAASAFGSGAAAEGILSIVAGTWSINAVVTSQPLVDKRLLMTTSFADAQRWMAIEASATSAANLSWFASEAFVDDDGESSAGSVFDRCCDAAAAAELRLSNPIYHPFLYGSPTDPQAKAGFYGVAGSHGRGDLARAVLEGVAFGHRRHVDDLVDVGALADRVRLTGGGARNAFWSQMFADVLRMPIEVPDAQETGARGAALAAGVGIGMYRDVDAAMEKATGVARSHQPNVEEADVYTQRFEIYLQLVEAMAPVWRSLATDPTTPTA
jgi:L-xylulokinase